MGVSPEVTLDRWAQKYGPLYSVWFGSQLHVVVSDPQIAKDLLETQYMIFSSRHESFVKYNTIFATRGISAAPFGESWCRCHRLVARYLTSDAVADYLPDLEFEAAELLKGLYIKGRGGTLPVDPRPHVVRVSLSNMLTVVFGLRTDSVDDPLVAHWLALARDFAEVAGPVASAVDFVPLLRKLPAAWTGVSRAQRLHEGLFTACGALVSDVERRRKAGENVPDSLVKQLLKAKEQRSLDGYEVVVLCFELVVSGVHKTAALIARFVAEIAEHPEVQVRAHAELDQVVGRDRIPGAEHKSELPYIGAIVKEIERLHNPLPLGIPHSNTEDFTYHNYVIPRDSVIILNQRALSTTLCDNPSIFNLERHIKDGVANPEPSCSIFGVGPRTCLGKPLAQTEVFLAVACMLWAFEVQPFDTWEQEAEEDGEDEHPSPWPDPFLVRLRPRHNRVSAVLGST